MSDTEKSAYGAREELNDTLRSYWALSRERAEVEQLRGAVDEAVQELLVGVSSEIERLRADAKRRVADLAEMTRSRDAALRMVGEHAARIGLLTAERDDLRRALDATEVMRREAERIAEGGR